MFPLILIVATCAFPTVVGALRAHALFQMSFHRWAPADEPPPHMSPTDEPPQAIPHSMSINNMITNNPDTGMHACRAHLNALQARRA